MNQFARRVVVALALCLVVVQSVAIAQNLGAAPQVNVAVQGQTGAQPEGAFRQVSNDFQDSREPMRGLALKRVMEAYNREGVDISQPRKRRG